MMYHKTFDCGLSALHSLNNFLGSQLYIELSKSCLNEMFTESENGNFFEKVMNRNKRKLNNRFLTRPYLHL